MFPSSRWSTSNQQAESVRDRIESKKVHGLGLGFEVKVLRQGGKVRVSVRVRVKMTVTVRVKVMVMVMVVRVGVRVKGSKLTNLGGVVSSVVSHPSSRLSSRLCLLGSAIFTFSSRR